jgi:methionine synthase II (cobalamin-independent)
MQRSTDRIRTTHVGSLARPAPLLDLMNAEAAGNPAGPGERDEAERVAVADVVARQRAAGLDVISDGEQSKPGFFAYIGERLSGFEPRPGRDPLAGFRAEIESFPEYYPTEAAYLDAVADALHEEYAAIVAAGFTLQIDDPFLTDVFSYHPGTTREKLEQAQLYVSAINRGLRGIGRERVRLHTCYAINEGPRVHDAELADMADTLFTIEAGAFSFEAANPRHEHVYHVFESVRPPDGAVLLPGVISHATSIVEHPDTIADRITRFAGLVGRENVVASADCGFSSQATYTPEIHPTIAWAKFEALAEGARRATARLWP